MGVGAGEGVVQLAGDEGALVAQGLGPGCLGPGHTRISGTQNHGRPQTHDEPRTLSYENRRHVSAHAPCQKIPGRSGRRDSEDLRIAARSEEDEQG